MHLILIKTVKYFHFYEGGKLITTTATTTITIIIVP